jgi:hypothetical protein
MYDADQHGRKYNGTLPNKMLGQIRIIVNFFARQIPDKIVQQKEDGEMRKAGSRWQEAPAHECCLVWLTVERSVQEKSALQKKIKGDQSQAGIYRVFLLLPRQIASIHL